LTYFNGLILALFNTLLNATTICLSNEFAHLKTFNMTEPVTFSAADQALCLAVLKQLEVGKIDHEKIRVELGLPTKGAAAVRWSRFNSKLKKGAASSPAKTTSTPPSIPPTKSKAKPNSPGKKRKLDTSDEEDRAGIQSLGAMDIKNEVGDDGF
jgi:hypothetical protein